MGDSLEGKKREIVQLLKEYRAWHTAFGAARPIDEQHIAEAAYGPAGRVLEGVYYYEDYPKVYIDALADSYDELEKAIGKVKRGYNGKGMHAWLILREPYFGDPADPTVVDRWRRVGDYRIQVHDVFVGWLAEELADTKLHPLWPKPYSKEEEADIEGEYAKIYATFQRIRASGTTEKEAVQQTADYYSLEKQTDLSADAVERIIEFRDTLKSPTCTEEGCNREPERGTLCMRHYMQARRRAKRSGKDEEEAC